LIDSRIIHPPKKFNILLIGDSCVDVYQYGNVDRISPEAPVPVIKLSHEQTLPGMASNVEQNLLALGCAVKFLTQESSKKTRIIDLKSRQHIVRIDQDLISTPVNIENKISNTYDAVVISDYNKGTVTYEMVEEIRKKFEGPIFVDTKKTDLARFDGCFVKINSLENNLAKSFPTDLIVTQGKHGATYKGKIYHAPLIEVTDVCGAGDTFLSALTYSYLSTKNIETAIKFAIAASSVTVQHTGVYAPTIEEIKYET
jgi:bifunctional ADP-heptose synthase (sugar kinase/adenylyltransferase)